ncbi:glycosyl hydrolase family 28-related protein [Pseudooceanicola sp. C21-150M6]|uniref:glycosyl hydrolase family 28-related protein n=1 Tax=Pseudooceanicola sp. C21-150M6 TaxID=3434355 RepID=UPI003D7F3DDB
MNKAITEGILFMPPAFEAGLGQWSSQDGTAGSDTYASSPNAAIVPADQDFGGCLELLKSSATQKLRYMGRTPILPGCYLRIRIRIKAVSGALPDVRIAGWAGRNNDVHVGGLVETGPSVSLDAYGEVVEVSAIVGSGNRSGVDMIWGTEPEYGYFGLDLTGATGGTVRIDDVVIEDITSAFLRDMMGWVDVRDYGAVGNGVTNDAPAFNAADADADGRTILIPQGTFRLTEDVTLDNPVRCEGMLSMPTGSILAMTRNFDLPSYIEAFKDEEEGFRKAFQALLNNTDHESLDMGGRRVRVTAPIDMQAAVPNKSSYATRRVIRNGQFECVAGSAFDTDTVTAQASYSENTPLTLTGVANIGAIAVGSLVTGNGVGREVYVTAKNTGASQITLSRPLYDAAGTQNFTFKRFKYLLDFSGFSKIDKLGFDSIEFQCWGDCSAILLAPAGSVVTMRDCFFTRPRDRGITSHGSGDQGMMLDRCQFNSDESAKDSDERVSIGFNANANDLKIRDCRSQHMRHFAVIAGDNCLFAGNHFFQGDGQANAVRTAGLIVTSPSCRLNFTGNYVDNCFIEWGNEHDQSPDFASELSFSAMTINDNTFLGSHVAPWFTFIVVKPYGPGHFINGMSVSGNLFRIIGDSTDRVESVDTSFASLDMSRMKNIAFSNNAFNLVTTQTVNPVSVEHSQNSAAATWTVSTAERLPFDGWAQQVEALVAVGAITSGSGGSVHDMPYVSTEHGSNRDQVQLHWGSSAKGKVRLNIRMDNPL